jgi:hypothetical protein
MSARRERKYACQAIKRWPYGNPESLTPEIAVEDCTSIFTMHDSLIPHMLSRRAIDTLKSKSNWLCCEFSDDLEPKKRHVATDSIKNSQLALQVVAPIGVDYPTVFTVEEGDGEPRIAGETYPQMRPTEWARLVGFSATSLEELKTVVKGVCSALASQTTRVVNPLYFFATGMESNHPYVRTFLWVTGLDALLMAGNENEFKTRLVNFLGADSLVFPNIPTFGQLRHRAQEVAGDLYEFRSIIAHGRPIDLRFREQRELISPDGAPSLHCMYHALLQESALFLLTGALKKIFMENLAMTVAEPRVWRDYLKTPHP